VVLCERGRKREGHRSKDNVVSAGVPVLGCICIFEVPCRFMFSFVWFFVRPGDEVRTHGRLVE
jgi:hypothetical protein